MMPLRFYLICPITVFRDTKNQIKEQYALTRSYTPNSSPADISSVIPHAFEQGSLEKVVYADSLIFKDTGSAAGMTGCLKAAIRCRNIGFLPVWLLFTVRKMLCPVLSDLLPGTTPYLFVTLHILNKAF